MKFNNKLYSLRKQKGLSQDELGSKINVSRQTISKWELGETTPELEKLIALCDFFEISLDELVMCVESIENTKTEPLERNMIKKVIDKIELGKVKKIFKIALIIIVIVFAIDLISMIVYFILNGFPITNQ